MSARELAAMSDQMLRASLSRSATATVVQPQARAPSAASTSASRTQASDRPPPYHSLYSNDMPKSNLDSLKKKMQEEVHRANAQMQRPDTSGLFKEMCSTDLLFLIDTTFSMGPYIDGARDQVKDIVADIKKTFLNEADVRISVVSYKDHQFVPDLITQCLDFTTSTDDVYEFLDGLTAGGATTTTALDWCENALGGIKQALNASWKQETRCIIHIADAPPHGHDLHDYAEKSDQYYKPGSEPHGLLYAPLLQQVIKLNINYAFLKIESGTDRMAYAFASEFGSGNATLLATNKYFDGSKHVAVDLDGKVATKPQFQEWPLGTSYGEIRHLVSKTVTSSFSRTASRTLALRADARPSNLMPSISEDAASNASDSQIALEDISPEWSDLEWFDGPFEMVGFCPAGAHNATTLNEMMDADANIKLSTARFTLHSRGKPFANGAMRAASYARTVSVSSSC